MLARITFVVTLLAAALATSAAPASALSLSAGTGATLAPFQPAHTATGSGSLTVVDLSLNWTLTVNDAGPGAGHMVKSAVGCSGSDAQLTNALSVTVTGLGVTSTGATVIGATAATVASGPITAGVGLTTGYSQVIPASQTMLTGCAYTLTATYTLQ
jgi:hypothetical protein